jgi:pectinesterase
MKVVLNKIKVQFFLKIVLLFLAQNTYAQYAKTVAKDGSGDYLTVQAAIDAAPTGQTTPYRIFIKNGTYKEVVNVPSNKPFIQLVGESVANTIITFDNFSGKPMPGGGTFGTSNSATVTINATDFSAVNITFENTTGESPQALAINVNNDRASFKNCRFLGGQDTLLANNNGMRQYYLNCYVDGTVDFIFGNARAVFDNCIIYPKDRSATGSSYITAANTKLPEIYGFVFRNCQITANTGNTSYFLGRPWQNDAATADASKSRNQTVFLNTKMGSSISPLGWAVWDAGTNTSYINYAEFNSLNPDGTPLNVSSRVSWSRQLNATEAAVYSDVNLFAGWDPTAVFLDGSTYAIPLVVSNFSGRKGSTTTPFRWNLSWPIAGVQYDVYRSTNNGVDFSIVNTQTASNDDVNFNYSAPNPPPGESYQYYLKASKSGLTDYTSSIITISSVPTVNVQGNLGAFLQGLGTPSNTQTYTVSGVDLTSNVVITPPNGFEISANGGTTWFGNSNPITLTPTNGTLANTTISVRLNASSAAAYSGNISHVSAGAATVNLAATGTTQTAPLLVSSTLITWPLTANNAATSVATGVDGSTVPLLNNFTLSNGTFNTNFPPYSTLHGMSFAVNANGGGWSSSATPAGPGNLNRNFYTEFTITPSANYQLRIDTILLNTSVVLTSGNFALSYSTNNFATFTDVNFGIAPDGNSVVFTSNGAINNTAIAIIREDGTNVSRYKFPLSNLNVAAGSNLKIRIYYRTGSSSDGRYVKIKDFTVKGEASSTLPLDLIFFNASSTNTSIPAVNLTWRTTNEVNTHKFDIERSVDGANFQSLGAVTAKNTSGIHDYRFTDYYPLSGVSYYRLKQLDLDGKFEYSPIKAVDITNNQIIIYPNPVSSELAISHLGAKAAGKLSVFDSMGKEVLKIDGLKSENQTKVDVSTLNSGVYFIQLQIGKEIFSSKFIKQ